MKKIYWVIIVIVVAIIALTVMLLMRDDGEEAQTTTSTTTTTTPANTVAAKTWTKGATAVKGQYADADTVMLAANSYRMYYAIQPEVVGNKFEVYSSTSTDGITWTADAGIRKTGATFPEVVKLADGTFRMYFQSAAVIKSAKSTDGLTFTDEAGTRIDKTNDLGLTFDNVAAPTVYLQDDGTYMMVYRGTINTPYVGETVPNKDTQILMWATSTDGLTWTKKGLALDTRDTTLYGLGDGPELFKSDDGLTLSFWSYSGVYWSTVTADGKFGTPKKVFALAEATAMNKFPTPTPGDPTYAQFGDTWYMYYGQKQGIDYAILK